MFKCLNGCGCCGGNGGWLVLIGSITLIVVDSLVEMRLVTVIPTCSRYPIMTKTLIFKLKITENNTVITEIPKKVFFPGHPVVLEKKLHNFNKFLQIQVVQEYERAVIFRLGRLKRGGTEVWR